MSKCRRPRGAGVSAKSGQVQTQGSKIGQNVRRPECKIPTNNIESTHRFLSTVVN